MSCFEGVLTISDLIFKEKFSMSLIFSVSTKNKKGKRKKDFKIWLSAVPLKLSKVFSLHTSIHIKIYFDMMQILYFDSSD